MREQLPPGSLLRRKYTLRMLEAASRRAEHLGQARSDAVEKLLKDMDRTTLESSRVLRESLAALEMFRKSSSLDKVMCHKCIPPKECDNIHQCASGGGFGSYVA